MSDDASKNGGSPGGTWRGDPSRAPLREGDLSETAFLNREAEAAKAAIVQRLRNIEKDIRSAADLRMGTRASLVDYGDRLFGRFCRGGSRAVRLGKHA